jgi:hypothetical protein
LVVCKKRSPALNFFVLGNVAFLQEMVAPIFCASYQFSHDTETRACQAGLLDTFSQHTQELTMEPRLSLAQIVSRFGRTLAAGKPSAKHAAAMAACSAYAASRKLPVQCVVDSVIAEVA